MINHGDAINQFNRVLDSSSTPSNKNRSDTIIRPFFMLKFSQYEQNERIISQFLRILA
jgi:hypothetical protein